MTPFSNLPTVTLSPEQRRRSVSAFNSATEIIMDMNRPMTADEMAALFDEDGYLGTAMKRLLLEQASNDDTDEGDLGQAA